MIRNFIKKPFSNKDIGFFHWFVLIDTIFLIITTIIHYSLTNFPKCFVFVFLFLLLVYKAFDIDKNNIALKFMAVGMLYCNAMIILNLFLSNIMSDSVNIAFVILIQIFIVFGVIKIIKSNKKH